MSRLARILSWTIIVVIATPLGLFIAEFLENRLFGTSYIEEFFMWLGWHEPIRLFLRDLLI